MRISKYVLAGVLSFGLGGTAAIAAPAPARAQEARPMEGELANFDHFLEAHPMIDLELQRQPALVDNPRFMANHRELRDFLRDHPGVRHELKAHPRYFIERADRMQHGGGNPTFVALREFDRFLDAHPEVDHQLRRKPMLLDDGNYVNAHPPLKEFLGSHPMVAQEIHKDPNYFMMREQHR